MSTTSIRWCVVVAIASTFLAATVSAGAPFSFGSQAPTVFAGRYTATPLVVSGADAIDGMLFLIPSSTPEAVIANVKKSILAAGDSDFVRAPITPINSNQRNTNGWPATATVANVVGVMEGKHVVVGFTNAQVRAGNESGFLMNGVVTAIRPAPSTSPILSPVFSFQYAITGLNPGDEIVVRDAMQWPTPPGECSDYCNFLLENPGVVKQRGQTVNTDGQVYASYNDGTVGQVGTQMRDCVCYRRSMATTFGNGNAFDFTPAPKFTPLDLGITGPLITNDPPLVASSSGTQTVRPGEFVTVLFTDVPESQDLSDYAVTLASVAPYSQNTNGPVPTATVVGMSESSLTFVVALSSSRASVNGVWSVAVANTRIGRTVAVTNQFGNSIGGKAFLVIELPAPVVTSVTGACAAKSADCQPREGNIKVAFSRPGTQAWTLRMALRFVPISEDATPITCYRIIAAPDLFECNLQTSAEGGSGTWKGTYNVDLVTGMAVSPHLEQVTRLDGTLAIGQGDIAGFGPAGRAATTNKGDSGMASPSPFRTTALVAAAVGGAVLIVALSAVALFLRRRRIAVTGTVIDDDAETPYLAAIVKQDP